MTNIEELARRCETAPHMSRPLNDELKAVEGAQFSHGYTGYVDDACRLVPNGFVWCCGTAFDDDGQYCWANVHNADPYENGRIDYSTRAASVPLALCCAALRARAALSSLSPVCGEGEGGRDGA